VLGCECMSAGKRGPVEACHQSSQQLCLCILGRLETLLRLGMPHHHHWLSAAKMPVSSSKCFSFMYCISVLCLLNRLCNVAFSICQNQWGLALWHNISWWEVSLFMKWKQLPLERWQRLVSFKNMRILIAAVKTQPTWTMPFNLY